jgi:lambda family phage portal protein
VRRATATFAGAALTRHFEDWQPWTTSPDWEVRWASRFMRARARALVRDNEWIAGFVGAVGDNVVGPVGRTLQANIRTALGAPVDATNREIERAYKEWGVPEFASADGRMSLVDIQRLRMITMLVDGEVLIRRLRGFDNPYGYALQFIDADLLDELYNVPASASSTGNEIRMGIEVDRWNRHLAYHVWSRYETDMSGLPRVRERIPASDVFYDFLPYRVNQTRGVTQFAPVLASLWRLDRYANFTLQGAGNGAAQMGFILNKHPDAVASYEPPKPGEERVMEVEAGIIPELLPGQEFVPFDPTQPSTTYEMFETATLRRIARGLKVSTLTLGGNLKEANFSSMRAGLTPERDMWRGYQEREAMHFDRPMYRDWIQMALINGAVRVDTRLASNYFEVQHEGRGWENVQPLDDIQADERAIRLSVTSRRRVAAKRGNDFEEVVRENAEDEQLAESLGVDVSGIDVIRQADTGPAQSNDPNGTDPNNGADSGDAPDGAPNKNAARLVALPGGRS